MVRGSENRSIGGGKLVAIGGRPNSSKCVSDGSINILVLGGEWAKPLLAAGVMSSVPAISWEHQPSGHSVRPCCAFLEDTCEPCMQDNIVLSCHLRSCFSVLCF